LEKNFPTCWPSQGKAFWGDNNKQKKKEERKSDAPTATGWVRVQFDCAAANFHESEIRTL